MKADFLIMQTSYKKLAIFALLPLLFGLGGCQNNQKNTPAAENAPISAFPAQHRFEAISPQSRLDLHRYFLAYKYNWNTIKQGVPLLIVDKFPADFYELAAGSERTRIFFLTLLPMTLLVNEEISRERHHLLDLFSRYDQQQRLSSDEIGKVGVSARNYKVDGDPLTDRRARSLLLNRLDQIPPSLALAQAASESAYGTSRFSRLGNNLFGEMTFNACSGGILPLDRPDGGRNRARVFPTLLDSLRAYIFNLNTHPAYQELREIRAGMQLRGEEIRGMELAKGLESYSTRKEAYVEHIRAIIRANNLPKLTANLTLGKKFSQSLYRWQQSPPLPDVPIPPQASIDNFYGRDLLSQN